ncbi:MAG: aspartyl/asparaginyl beta-hydroxylase domain-containing protein [Pseudobdellovibrio sp.]
MSKLSPLYKKSYSPYTEWDPTTVQFCRLPDFYSFEIEKLRSQILEVGGKVGYFPLNKIDATFDKRYNGFGFTSRNSAPDPDHDAFRLYNENGEFDSSSCLNKTMNQLLSEEPIHKFERNFTEKTKHYGGYLDKVLSRFKSPMTKVRVMKLDPGGIVPKHFDYPYYENIRVHAAIETNTNVEWKVEDQTFSIPADGNFYWFDTGRFHQVSNFGNSPRIVLSVHLSIYKNFDGSIRLDSKSDLQSAIQQCLL